MTVNVYMLLLLLGLTHGQYDDYYDDYGYEEDYSSYSSYSSGQDDYTMPAPTIITKAREVKVAEGMRMRLECRYDGPVTVPIIWSKVSGKNTVIAVDKMMLDQDYQGRGQVTVDRQGSVLTINATTADAGTYKCTIASSQNAPELLQTVTILTPATILSVTPALVEVVKGKDLLLVCSGSGEPKPSITWRRLGRRNMPDGSYEIRNETVMLTDVSEEDSGTYECTAANGVGAPDTKQVQVVVEVEKAFFFGPDGGRITPETRFKVGLDFEMTMMIKPRNSTGILAAVKGRPDYLLLQMVNGSVHFTVENGRGPISAVFRPTHTEELCDGQWHEVRAVKVKNVVILSVNKIFAQPGIGTGGSSSTDTNNPLNIGGHPRPNIPDITTASYSGCMKDVVIDGKPLDITDEKIFGMILRDICPTV
jgi:hypothetical protein